MVSGTPMAQHSLVFLKRTACLLATPPFNMLHDTIPLGKVNCGIRHVTVPIATRILIANVRHIGVSNICVINLVYFKMQV